jgi:hypothetical protein
VDRLAYGRRTGGDEVRLARRCHRTLRLTLSTAAPWAARW